MSMDRGKPKGGSKNQGICFGGPFTTVYSISGVYMRDLNLRKLPRLVFEARDQIGIFVLDPEYLAKG